MTKRPNSLRHLDNNLRRKCETVDDYLCARTIMASAIVAGMLPSGVVKGGTAIKTRFGDVDTRFTTDLDTASAASPTQYAEELSEALAAGWEGFTGQIVPKDAASPVGVPNEYVMQPYDVKLSYLGKPWCTVPLEVGHNEIGDADNIEWAEQTVAAKYFAELGLPSPGKAPLMPLTFQIAQKIHAVSGEGDRARDMIDLQLIVANSQIDLSEVQEICVRLFAYRNKQAWPTEVKKQRGWETIYAEQASGLAVLQNVDDAISWTNALIQEIADA